MIAFDLITGNTILVDAREMRLTLDDSYLQILNNLSDLNNVATARTNLGLVAGGTGDIWVEKAGDTMTGFLTLSADPTAKLHAATKEYVDTAIGFQFDYFFNNTSAGIGATGYFNMTDTSLGGAETTDLETSISSGTDNQELFEFITLSGQPGVEELSAGVYSFHFHAERTSGNSTVDAIYVKLYKYAIGPTETLLGTSELTAEIVQSKESYEIHLSVGSEITLDPTDRLLVKFFANTGSGGGSGSDVEIYAEGDTSSRFSFQTSSEILSTLYIRQDGTKAFSGNQDFGTNDITGVGSLGVTGTRLTKGWFDDLEVTNAVGIGITPSSVFHIKANTSGVIGDNQAGQLIIQSPTNNVNTNVVITGYKSNAGGAPDVQLWYLGSSTTANANITFLNRQNDTLTLGTNDTTRLTISAAGSVDVIGAFTAGTISSDTNITALGNIELGHVSDTTLIRVSAGLVSIQGNNILVSGGALGTPSSGTLTNCTFPTLNQNTTGTAANLSGTPDLPNGTTATTQAGSDNSTKLATTAYADAAAAAGGANVTLSNLTADSVAINTTLASDADNTDALGTAAISWSDLWLGNLSVITWSTAPSTADITLTHAADSLTFAGGTIILGTATATGGLTGNVTGNVTGSSGSTTGNAATATTLETPRNIGGVSFDGSAAITVASATGGFAISGGNLTSTGTLQSGAAAGTNGQITLTGSTSGTGVIKVNVTAGAGIVFQLPSSNGANTNVLQTNGSGVTSWVAAGTGDVAGDSASIDKELVRFNSTTGKIIESPNTDNNAVTATLSDNVDLTLYEATNDGNPVFSYGSSSTNRLRITPTYDGTAQTLDYVDIATDSANAGGDKGEFRFSVDGSLIATIDDGGIELADTKSYFIDTVNVLSETTLGSSVLASSLTSVGSLAGLTMAGSITMAANTITGVGTITATNAAGPTIVNEAATNTNPTLIPNKAEDDTGIGWTSDELNIVLGGVDEYSFTTTALVVGVNNITMTGSLGATGAAKLTKIWATDAELTNLPTINSGTLASALNLSGTNTGDNTVATALTGTPSITVNAIITTGTIDLGHATDTTFARVSGGTVSIQGQNILTAATGAAIAQTFYIGTTQVAINRGSGALTLAGLTLTTPNIGTPSGGTLTSCTGLPAAGVVNTAATLTDTQTLTNKRITQRVTTEASSATPTINTDNSDDHSITALATNITSMTTNLSGTPTNFQKLIVRFLDNGTPRTISWGIDFRDAGVALPATTTTSKVLTVGFIFDTVTGDWGCVAVADET